MHACRDWERVYGTETRQMVDKMTEMSKQEMRVGSF